MAELTTGTRQSPEDGDAPTSNAVDRVETRSAVTTISPEGFVLQTAKPESALEYEDAVENIQAMATVLRHPSVRLRRCMVDLRPCVSASREARKHFGEQAGEHVEAVAMLVDDGLSRVIANFFVGLSRLQLKIRIFSVEQLAREWLTS